MSDPTARRLAAILHADVAGYSRLMADDEAATATALEATREVSGKHVAALGGRVIDMAGDSVLALFETATGATQAALAIQAELAARNAPREEKRRMRFRIGVNLGEVTQREDGSVYGDGVNVAARLQELAEPGGVCVSGTVFDQVEGKLPVSFRSIGQQRVKNIPKPVRAYRTQVDGLAPRFSGSRRRPGAVLVGALVLCVAGGGWYLARTATEKSDAPGQPATVASKEPSIAVLPFRSMSGSPDDEWFSDGMTETLITDLSRVPNLIVISRESTFTYKGKSVDVRHVGKELNVRYVLEGSVQRTNERLRLNAQLIEAATGHHLWAERFDRPLDDVFAVQDEITDRIMTEIDVTVVSGPQARAYRGSTRDRQAYELFLRAFRHFYEYTQEGFFRAEELLAQALRKDPQFTRAMTLLGWVYYQQGDAGWRRDSQESYRMALEMARRATAVHPHNGNGYVLEASVLAIMQDHPQALAAAEKALAVEPNVADVVANVAWIYTAEGRAEEAVPLMQRAFRLNPFAPAWMHGAHGDSLLWAGYVDESVPALHKCVDQIPDFLLCRLALTYAYVQTGKLDDARAHAREALRINPRITAKDNTYTLALGLPQSRARVIAALRRAGLR